MGNFHQVFLWMSGLQRFKSFICITLGVLLITMGVIFLFMRYFMGFSIKTAFDTMVETASAGVRLAICLLSLRSMLVMPLFAKHADVSSVDLSPFQNTHRES